MKLDALTEIKTLADEESLHIQRYLIRWCFAQLHFYIDWKLFQFIIFLVASDINVLK